MEKELDRVAIKDGIWHLLVAIIPKLSYYYFFC
jgi:hypothetical protein